MNSRGDTRSGNAWNPGPARGDKRQQDRGDASRNSRGDTRSGSAWNPGPVRDKRSEVTRDAGGCSRDDMLHNTWNPGPVRDTRSVVTRDAGGCTRDDTSHSIWNPGPVRDTRSEVTRDAGGCTRDDTSHSIWNPGPVRDTRSEVTWDAGGCSRDDPTWNTGPVRDIRSLETRDSRESIVGDRRNMVDWITASQIEAMGGKSGPSRDDGKFEELPGSSNGSSGRSKRPREPSPSTAGPAIRINTSIFETDPSETDNNSLPEDNQDMRDVKRKIEKGDPEITEEMQSLGNFFSFTDPSKALPNVAPQRNVGEAGALVPKMPKVTTLIILRKRSSMWKRVVDCTIKQFLII
ncbi:unnamed protein product, partial [Allacma fusca]